MRRHPASPVRPHRDLGDIEFPWLVRLLDSSTSFSREPAQLRAEPTREPTSRALAQSPRVEPTRRAHVVSQRAEPTRLALASSPRAESTRRAHAASPRAPSTFNFAEIFFAGTAQASRPHAHRRPSISPRFSSPARRRQAAPSRAVNLQFRRDFLRQHGAGKPPPLAASTSISPRFCSPARRRQAAASRATGAPRRARRSPSCRPCRTRASGTRGPSSDPSPRPRRPCNTPRSTCSRSPPWGTA